MKFLTTVAILIFSFWSNQSSAQVYIDLFKFDHTITPTNKFDSSDYSTTLREINADLTVPVRISEKTAILSGLSYETINVSLDANRKAESVTGLTLKLGVNVKHNEKWSGTYMFLPKISSDFNKISSDDYQFGGAVLMKYSKSDRLNYQFGVYGNKELFGPMIVPILGFYYINPSKKFEAKVLLPMSADLNYAVRKNVRLGLNFKGQVRTYNLNSEEETNRYVTRSSNDLFGYVQYNLKNGINLQAGVGRSFGRSYRMYNEKVNLAVPMTYFGDKRKQLNSDFSDSWLFKVGVFYRFGL